MELSLRLDTLGMVEMRYLRRREQYRDWPQFQLTAASRQARIAAYMNHEVAEQLHQQILLVEEAVGLGEDDDEEDEEDEQEVREEDNHGFIRDEAKSVEQTKLAEREPSAFSPALAQALKQLNELARQRLPDANAGAGSASGELMAEAETADEEEDALEQLQDAFTQMMEVVRELAEEMATDALKLMGRFKCARTNIEFIPQALSEDEDDEEDQVDNNQEDLEDRGVVEMEVELVMVLQLFEEGRSRADDAPAVELQLDVDDFERLHETLDIALEHERRSRRRR
jgi:hypothetical protein